MKYFFIPRRWKLFFKILKRKEKIVFLILLFLSFTSFIFLSVNFYFKNTEIKPGFGGIHIEGMVGQPRHISPIYVSNDIGRDITKLIFPGLMKHSREGIVYDLASQYKVLEEGRVYEFRLKENIFWHDGQPFSADDVIFTIRTIQNPEFKSPLAIKWLGKEIEKIDNLTIRFNLPNPSAHFLEDLTIGIIPKHIWQDISPNEFPLALNAFNPLPIGTGPFKFIERKIDDDPATWINSIILDAYPLYHGKKPYISKIIFQFFSNEEELIKAVGRQEIKGFSLPFPENDNSLIKNFFNFYNFPLTNYFAVFFNPDKSEILKDKAVRQALNYATNKKEIIQEVLKRETRPVHSPILPEIFDFSHPQKIYEFNPEKAKEILEKAGFKDENMDGRKEKIIKKIPAFQLRSRLQLGSRGLEVRELQKCLARDQEIYPEGEITGHFGKATRAAVIRFQEKYSQEILKPWGFKKGTGMVGEATRTKLNNVCFGPPEEILPLSFSLTTVNQPQLSAVANFLKKQWQIIGVELEIKTYDISDLERDIIRTRNYQSVLFGNALDAIPNPFPFWHSSQIKSPGLNLSLYENKKADELLEKIQQSLDKNKRQEKLEQFQNILIEDAPVVFLYGADHFYLVSKEIKGIKEKIISDPSKRFINIENWYIETRRRWK